MVRGIWHGCYDNGNFGDHVGPYVIKKLTGIELPFAHDSRQFDEVNVYSGSVLQESKENWVMYGCGFGESDQVCHEKPRRIVSVRGKLSRQMLLDQGIECPEVYFDICQYLPSIYYPEVEKDVEIGWLPHYIDDRSYREADSEIHICSPIEAVIRQVLRCKTIVSSSLHGLILADVYGIPRIWHKHPDLSEFKFQDYFSRFMRTVSMGRHLPGRPTFGSTKYGKM